MPDIPTDFRDDQMKDIEWAASVRGMTVEQFVSHATNKCVKDVKENARKRIRGDKPSLKKLT